MIQQQSQPKRLTPTPRPATPEALSRLLIQKLYSGRLIMAARSVSGNLLPYPEVPPMGKVTSVSPFAPKTLVKLPAIEGVAFATAEAGIRYKGRTDLLLAVVAEGTTVAGVLTQSKTASAPVLACRKHLKKVPRGAGREFRQCQRVYRPERRRRGGDDSRACCRGRELPAPRVFVASTGVIGEPLDAEKFAHLAERSRDAGRTRRL